jgi:hypothetical protein
VLLFLLVNLVLTVPYGAWRKRRRPEGPVDLAASRDGGVREG